MNMKEMNQKIRERIQQEFLQLMSDEDWKQLVDKELKWFLSDTTSNYGRKIEPSPLRCLIQQELSNIFKDKIKILLTKPEYQTQYCADLHNPELPGEAVLKIVKECAPLLWEQVVGLGVQDIVNKIRSISQSNF